MTYKPPVFITPMPLVAKTGSAAVVEMVDPVYDDDGVTLVSNDDETGSMLFDIGTGDFEMETTRLATCPVFVAGGHQAYYRSAPRKVPFWTILSDTPSTPVAVVGALQVNAVNVTLNSVQVVVNGD